MRSTRMTGFTALILLLLMAAPAGAQSGPSHEKKTGERHAGPPREHGAPAPGQGQKPPAREHDAPQAEKRPANPPRETKQRTPREPTGQAAPKGGDAPDERARKNEKRVNSVDPPRTQEKQHPLPKQKPAENQREAPVQHPEPRAAAPEKPAQPVRTREQAREWQQKKAWVKPGAWQGGQSWQQARARHWETEHRSWAQRGGYGGYVIPRDTFSVHFGIEHPFFIRSRPVIYLGYPRFYYASYSFIIVDPWPEYWEETWYDDDDVYIIYDDGYYLYSRREPGVRLAVSIVF